jgi:hypothetical protein
VTVLALKVALAPLLVVAATLAGRRWGAAVYLIGPPPRRVFPDRPPPAWDLPARAGLTAVLVVALTGAAGALGPAVSGVLTPFPVAMSVIAAFVLAQDGGDAARSLLHGFARALPGFAVSFFAVAIVL